MPQQPARLASRRAQALATSEPRESWYRIGPVVNVAVGDSGTSDSTVSSADVYVYDTIGGWLGVTAEDFVTDVAGLDVDRLVVHLNSPGGDAFEGVAMANVLRAHRAEIVVHVDGIAASAATIIAMAGDEIVMGVGSQLMIHDAWGLCVGNAADMTKTAQMLSTTSNSIASTYAHRAGGTAAEWRAAMAEETWFTAEEAVVAKLADRVATEDDKGTASGEQVVPGAGAPGYWDMWDSYRSQDRFDLSVFNYAGRRNAPAPRTPAASSTSGPTTDEGGAAVAFTDEQLNTIRQRLGVADNADESTILAALDEALDEALTEQAEPANVTTVPEGKELVSSAELADLRANAENGAKAWNALKQKERDDFLNAMNKKYAPANRAAWEAEYDRDPEGTRQHFASAPDIIPTSETGHSGNSDPLDAEYAKLFPDETKASA